MKDIKTKSLRLPRLLAIQAEQEASANNMEFSEYVRNLIESDINSRVPFRKETLDIYTRVSNLIQGLEAIRDYKESQFTEEMNILGYGNNFKTLVENVLTITPKAEKAKNEWLVDGKKVVNNLSYGEMWKMYGTDFE